MLYVNSETNEVLITTNGAVNGGTYLGGTKAYFRGATELNNICKALYSNSTLGLTAKAMAVEDLNKVYNNRLVAQSWSSLAIYPYGTTFESGDTAIEYNGKTYTKVSHYYENIGKFYTSDGGGVEKVDSDGFTYREPQADNPVYVTDRLWFYDLRSVVNVLGGEDSFIASQCSVAEKYGMAGLISWGFQYYYASGVIAPTVFYASEERPNKFPNAIRPIVSLGSKLKIDTTDTTRDGSTSAKAWKLIKK